MMVKTGIYFEIEVVDRILEALQDLPAPFKPVHFSEEEYIQSDKDVLADTQRFSIFKKNNQAGFFLFSNACTYNFFLYRRGYAVFYCYFKDMRLWSHIISFFAALAPAGPVFGYAAESDEYDHRNRYFVTIGQNHIESWIGRDLSKYIPGVYWCTLLSNALLDRHRVRVSDLSCEAMSTESLGDGSIHLLKFYERPEDWQLHVERLDDLCERVQGVFSRRAVESAAEGAKSFLEFDEAIAMWR